MPEVPIDLMNTHSEANKGIDLNLTWEIVNTDQFPKYRLLQMPVGVEGRNGNRQELIELYSPIFLCTCSLAELGKLKSPSLTMSIS